MAYRPMSKPITPLRGLTPTLFSCTRPLPGPRPGHGQYAVQRAAALTDSPHRPAGVSARAAVAGWVARSASSVWSAWAGAGRWGAASGDRLWRRCVRCGRRRRRRRLGSGSASASGVGGVGVRRRSRRRRVAGRAGTGIGDDPGAGESVGAVDGIPIVPAGTPPLGAVGTPGVGMSLGPVVDRTGTVTTGCPVGPPLPARPSTPVGDPDEVGEPVSPRAGSAGPPARMVITVTAKQPTPCDAERLQGVGRPVGPFPGTMTRSPCCHARTLTR